MFLASRAARVTSLPFICDHAARKLLASRSMQVTAGKPVITWLRHRPRKLALAKRFRL